MLNLPITEGELTFLRKICELCSHTALRSYCAHRLFITQISKKKNMRFFTDTDISIKSKNQNDWIKNKKYITSQTLSI